MITIHKVTKGDDALHFLSKDDARKVVESGDGFQFEDRVIEVFERGECNMDKVELLLRRGSIKSRLSQQEIDFVRCYGI